MEGGMGDGRRGGAIPSLHARGWVLAEAEAARGRREGSREVARGGGGDHASTEGEGSVGARRGEKPQSERLFVGFLFFFFPLSLSPDDVGFNSSLLFTDRSNRGLAEVNR